MSARAASLPPKKGERRGLHRFALFTACSTSFLIFVGGLVTSTESGLAVPDWPLAYGMFFPPMLPVSVVEALQRLPFDSSAFTGIFYEHSHRMVATFVGFLTVILTLWICLKDERTWVRRLSVGAFIAVLAQGGLGGLTVRYLLPTPISVLHACLAQTFFCMTIALAIFTSPRWKRGLPVVEERLPGMSLRALCAAMTGAVYFQLVLGALMRHTKSGLAIPDFPLAFGGIIPEFTSEKVAIHFAHRIGAVIVTAAIVWTFWRVRRFYRDEPLLARPAAVLLCLVLAQFTLGAFTVWSAKHFLITTAHVATGALVLGVSFLLTVRAFTMVRRGTAPTTYPAREAAWR